MDERWHLRLNTREYCTSRSRQENDAAIHRSVAGADDPSFRQDHFSFAARNALFLSQSISRSPRFTRMCMSAGPSHSALKKAADRHFRSTAPSSLDSRYWSPPKAPVDLHGETEDRILDRIDETVAFVLDCLGPSGSVVTNWKVRARRNGMAFYEDHTLQERKQTETTQTRYCCVAQTIASVEDLMALFVATDNDSLKKNARVIHSKVVDTRLISVLKEPTAMSPYASTSVKYTRVSSGMWHRDRDMCAVVATDFVEMQDGSMMGYCLWDSVEVDECPDLTLSQGVQRTRMVRSGYIMRNTGQPEANTRIVYFCGLDMDAETTATPATDSAGRARRVSVSQQLTPATTFHALDEIGGNLERICAHFRRKPLDVHQFVKRSDYSSLSQARYCCSCNHRFSIMSRRFNCTACGEVMCRTCCKKEEVDLPGVGLKNMRICAICVRGMDQTFRMSRASSSSVFRSTTSRSNAGLNGGYVPHSRGTDTNFTTINPSPAGSTASDFRNLRGTTSKLTRW